MDEKRVRDIVREELRAEQQRQKYRGVISKADSEKMVRELSEELLRFQREHPSFGKKRSEVILGNFQKLRFQFVGVMKKRFGLELFKKLIQLKSWNPSV